MTDKISGYSPGEPVVPVKNPAVGNAVGDKTAGDPPAAGTAAAQPSDQVTLTESARSLQKLEAAIASAPGVDTAKVHAVKKALAEGTYAIDPRRIADKLVKFDSELK